MTVLVLGDANVDLEIRLPAGAGELANPDPEMFGGGSAANTAAALARLSVDTAFVGIVGDDSFGRFAVASLEAAGVDVSRVAISSQPTVAVIPVSQPDGERLIYVWPPRGGAHGDLTPEAAIGALEGARWLHVSGICLRLSPSREALIEAMAAASAVGVPVSFDLNLRLENWGWDGGFRTAVDKALDVSDVVLGSGEDELRPLSGAGTVEEALLALARPGRVVVARVGRSGALACDGQRVLRSDGFEVEVVDTLGAGDAFNAGFISARLDGGDLADALALGNAVAALTTTRHGARSTPSRDQAAALLGGRSVPPG